MGDDTGIATHQEPEPGIEPPKPAPMGRGFYIVMGLIGVLVFLIIFFNLPSAEAAAPVTLMHTDWMIRSYTGSTGTLVPVQNGTSVSARFGTGGQLAGSAGCNRYLAAYSIIGDSLNITGIASTQVYCLAPGVMEQESHYLNDLQQVSLYRIHGMELYLYDATGKTLLVFAPAGS